jgi:hypothetical protein
LDAATLDHIKQGCIWGYQKLLAPRGGASACQQVNSRWFRQLKWRTFPKLLSANGVDALVWIVSISTAEVVPMHLGTPYAITGKD